MRSFQLLDKHNTVHLIQLLVTVLLLFLVNVIIIRFSASQQIESMHDAEVKLAHNKIENKFEDIENFCTNLETLDTEFEAEAYARFMDLFLKNAGVMYNRGDRSVMDVGEGAWSMSPEYVPIFNKVIGEREHLSVRFEKGWLDSLFFQEFLIDYQYFIISNATLMGEGLAKFGFESESTIENSQSRYHFNMSDRENLYHAALIPMKRVDYSIVIYKPGKRLLNYMMPYLFNVFILYMLVLLVMGYFIVRINNRFLYPFKEIIKSLEAGNYVSVKHQKLTNVPVLLKRSIDLLQNQLKFYEQNLEKSKVTSKKIEHELKIAKQLQNNILPRKGSAVEKNKMIDLEAYSEAAYDIGGDLYDYFMLNDDELIFVVGDVSGKGIPAALFMIYTQTSLRTVAKPGMKVSEIVNVLNDRLIDENISDLFVTMFVGIINLKTKMLSYTNAAHNHPLLIKKEGELLELQETHGIPLGVYGNRKYKESQVQLNLADKIMVYTDGLTDTLDENGLNYSLEVLKFNLMGAWFSNVKEVLNKIQKSVVEFRGNKEPVDDLTLLIVECTSEDAMDKD